LIIIFQIPNESSVKNIITYYENVKRPLVLDGAIGSLIQQRNVELHKTLWSSYANIVAPEKVIEVHKEYINAGADIITTNTFRTNPTAYNKALLKISNIDFVKASVELAKEAIEENGNIFVAGSNPSAEDSYQTFRNTSKNEIELNHKSHVDMLWESGVDFILNETQSHFDEIKIICKHCNANQIPFIISLFVTQDGKILSGETLNEILKYVADFNPIAVGINCVTPEIFSGIIGNIDTKMRWGFYLNCGSGNFTDTEIFEGVTPANYIGIVNQNFKNEPFFIGSCCGSSPEHTKAIKEFIIGKNRS
jgi:S-methylmethionine-dependent homocysteine/selenocysteine methylase